MAIDFKSVGALAGGAGSIVGGLLGRGAASGDRKQAERLLKDQLRYIDSIDLPDVEKMRIVADLIENQGNLEDIIQMEALPEELTSEASQVTTDPRLREAQLNALNYMEQIGTEGGLTPEEAAEQRMTDRLVDREAQAAQKAIIANMAARGVGGSGTELQARLAASQGADARRAEAFDRLAVEGRQRALQAMERSGQLGSQIRGQDFSENFRTAQAADEIARINQAQKMDAARRNFERLNQTRARDLAERQRIAEANRNIRSQADLYNKQLEQQRYENEMRKAAARQGSNAAMADYYSRRAANTAQGYADIGRAVGTGGAAAYQMWGQGEKEQPTVKAQPVAMNYTNEEKDKYGGIV